MKYNKIIYTVLVAATLGAAGCSKEKFSINSNPDDVTEAAITPSLLLPAAQQATATLMVNDFWFLEWWMGHGARSGSYQTLNDEETYKFTNDFKAGNWNALYANARNYYLMTNKAAALGQDLYEAIGRIMRSHNFQMLVDLYNNIPYSQAFQTTDIPTPKYDKGIDVYKGILADLDAAEAILEDIDSDLTPSGNPDITTADFVFQGNATRWLQFLNTLRLRVLVHLHNGITTTSVVPGINVAAEIAKVGPEGFLGAGQSAQMQPGFSGTKPQPYYRFYVTNEAGTTSQRDFLRASDYAMRYYSVDGDPRRQRFYAHPTSGAKGIVFGTPSGSPGALLGDALSSVRGLGYSFTAPNVNTLTPASRAWILTATESLLLQAEARQRGFLTTGPSAAQLYESAVRESFIWLGLTNADADAYFAWNAGYPDVDITAPGGGLYTIISQKWFSLNMINSLEIWNDFRRTDIVYGVGGGFDPGPTISVDPGAASSIPKRLLYPQSEYNYNAANVLGEGTINYFTNRIFWDLN